jgi:hypothetical protein
MTSTPPPCQHTRNDGREFVSGHLVCKKDGELVPFTKQPGQCGHSHAYSMVDGKRICHECGGEF